MKEIIKTSSTLGVKHLTVYAFSTENWKRSDEEVSGIFKLLVKYVDSELEELNANNVRVRILGDYNWMMSFTEKLLETICIAVNGKPEREIDGNIISFKAPYRRLPILDAIKEKTGFDCNGKTEEEIRAFCKEKGMDVDETMGKGKLIDELFGEFSYALSCCSLLSLRN